MARGVIPAGVRRRHEVLGAGPDVLAPVRQIASVGCHATATQSNGEKSPRHTSTCVWPLYSSAFDHLRWIGMHQYFGLWIGLVDGVGGLVADAMGHRQAQLARQLQM